jgi:hypothetical protein
MAHLADGYRRRYYERQHPPQQLRLPGFGETFVDPFADTLDRAA